MNERETKTFERSIKGKAKYRKGSKNPRGKDDIKGSSKRGKKK